MILDDGHQHHVEIERENLPPRSWYPRCDCGWEGFGQASRRDAEDDGDGHVLSFTR